MGLLWEGGNNGQSLRYSSILWRTWQHSFSGNGMVCCGTYHVASAIDYYCFMHKNHLLTSWKPILCRFFWVIQVSLITNYSKHIWHYFDICFLGPTSGWFIIKMTLLREVARWFPFSYHLICAAIWFLEGARLTH